MAKILSFAVVHISVAFSVGYLMTGSIAVGGALALVEPLVNSVAYFFHEKVWMKIERRNHPARKPDQTASSFMPSPQAATVN